MRTITEGYSMRLSHKPGKDGRNPVSSPIVDINDLFLSFTLDTATEFLLGTSVDSLLTLRQDFTEAFAEAQRIQNFITRSGPANFHIPNASYNAGIRTIERFVDPSIEEALFFSPDEFAENTEAKHTFLQAPASVNNNRKVLRDQIVAILLAGRDTTAAALSWIIYELAKHPEILRKLRAEIIDTVGLEAAPTYRNLKHMKYLQRIMNEALRLYPSVPSICEQPCWTRACRAVVDSREKSVLVHWKTQSWAIRSSQCSGEKISILRTLGIWNSILIDG